MEKLFSYGTLQMESVQLESFGRTLTSSPDVLMGYIIKNCVITDPKVIQASGKSVHPIACLTDNPCAEISGMIFELTPEELQQADEYEAEDYQRVLCTLKSGRQAWTYVAKEDIAC